jgi:chaperone LolA
MKRLLAITLILAFCLSPLALRAQISHASQGRLDENATAALKKASARFNQNVSFTVTLTALDQQHKTVAKQSAQVRYNKGRYRLVVPDMEIISDGTTVWQWNKKANEVAVTNVSDDDIDLLNPGRLLANYDKSFKAKYIRTDDDGTAVIDLQPRSTRSYHKIRLFINEEDGLLRRMEVHKYDSSREVYDVTDFKRTSNAASQFTFDPKTHPDAEIIDMR